MFFDGRLTEAALLLADAAKAGYVLRVWADPVLLEDAAPAACFHTQMQGWPQPLSSAAQGRGIPILVEAERLRDKLPDLLQHATYVTSSAHYSRVSRTFPALAHRVELVLRVIDAGSAGQKGESPTSKVVVMQDATGHEQQGDAMVALFASLPNARWLVSTQGDASTGVPGWVT